MVGDLVADLVIYLLSKRWSWIIIGALMIIGGVLWGRTSHQINYTQINGSASYYDIGTGETSGNTYFNASGSDDYYVAFADDFSVPQSDLKNAISFTIIARTDTSTLNRTLSIVHGYKRSYVSSAHKIEKLVLYGRSGSILASFTTEEYKANPGGVNDNEWIKAIWLIIAGVIIAGAALIVPMVRKRP